jgi:hydrogenase expression/formation protein HypD
LTGELRDVFKDRGMAEKLSDKIRGMAPPETVKIMHVCGTHEQTIMRHGLRTLLPDTVEVVPGPGCPVCITPAHEVDMAIALAKEGHVITTYGDMVRVPGTAGSLALQRSRGGDVRIIYSLDEAVRMARDEPDKEFVFFGIGFETTTPMTARALLDNPPENFSILCSHRVVPPALDFLLSLGELGIEGFLDPGHVSTIIGTRPYEPLTERYGVPQVIAGFEPLDVLMGVYMLLKQINSGEAKVENEYTRVVSREGNIKAQEAMAEVFKPCTRPWRGLPEIPDASLEIRKEFEDHDAVKRFDIQVPEVVGEACGTECPLCGDILRGLADPKDCELFGKTCTPENPVGACMVSTEGTCRIAYVYGRD